MKRLYTLALSTLCVAGASAESLTVFPDGSATSTYLPFNIYYASDNIHSQMIYPESALAQLKGKVVEKVSFTLTRVGSTWTQPSFTVKMGTTAQTDYTSATYIAEGLSEVATITNLKLETGTVPLNWDITLDAPFTYTGGNLVIDMTNVKGYGPRNWTFKGAAQSANTGISMTRSTTLEKFLPTITFEYSSPSAASAALSATDLNMGLVFTDTPTPTKVTLTNTGSQPLSGTVTVSNSTFTVEPATITDLAAGQSIDLNVKLDADVTGIYTADMTVALDGIAPIAARLSGTAVNAPGAVRTLFTQPDYADEQPDGWGVLAIEYFEQSGEISDATTDYSLFPSVKFGSANIAGFNAITWVYANPMGFTDLYNREYYLISPSAGGRFTLGAAYTETLATEPYVKAYAATYNESTRLYEIGSQLPITWDIAPDKEKWGYGSGTAPAGGYVALLIKYGALNYFAADDASTAIADLKADSTAPVRYFNLQGVEMTGHLTPGLYIRQQGPRTAKVIVK